MWEFCAKMAIFAVELCQKMTVAEFRASEALRR